MYYISKARINIAKKQFSTVNNEYEITFDGKTEVDLCEDEGVVPQIKFNFIELSALDQMEKDQTCGTSRLLLVLQLAQIADRCAGLLRCARCCQRGVGGLVHHRQGQSATRASPLFFSPPLSLVALGD